jgi:hypothetical protein
VAFSLFLDFFPVIGTIKGAIEAITGRDLITGDELPNWARALGAAAAAIPAARAGWKLVGLGVKVARRAATVASTTDVGGWGRGAMRYKSPSKLTVNPTVSNAIWELPEHIRGILIEKVLGSEH